MRSILSLLVLISVVAFSPVAQADDQVPPAQEEVREHFQTFSYSEATIRDFVTREFAASKVMVKTEPVIQILIRDLAKDGAGGFRIAPQDYEFTFEYRRVGADVVVDKVSK